MIFQEKLLKSTFHLKQFVYLIQLKVCLLRINKKVILMLGNLEIDFNLVLWWHNWLSDVIM